MIKLTQEHIDAICHAELFLESAQEGMESRRVILALDKDKLKLIELKLYVIESMSQPKLPYVEPGDNVEKPGQSKSR